MSVTINGTTGISSIPDDIVTTDKILDGAVTDDKLDSTVLDTYLRFEQLAPVATTSGTIVTISGIEAWAKKITLTFNEVSVSGTDDIIIRAVDNSGTVTTGYNSSSMRNSTASTYNFVATSTAGLIVQSNAAVDSLVGTYTLVNYTGNVWVGSGTFLLNATNMVTASGLVGALSGAIEGFNIVLSSSNTWDNGGIAVLVEG
jgi:hypothetical protein